MNEIINLGNGQFVKVIMFKGERGSNIATITKTGISGLVDTYTITLTDGSTTSFEVKNGSSIDYIAKTSSVGSVDVYTIYLTDGTVGGTFEVNNAIATVEQNFSSTSTNPLMNKTLTNIIAGVENGSTASKTYYANDLILRNDSLYEVTTTVAVGTAWADGVNIYEKTLGELIAEINSDLSELSDEVQEKGIYTLSSTNITTTGIYPLNDDINNYDLLLITHRRSSSDIYLAMTIDVEIFKTGVTFNLDSNENAGNRQIQVKYSDDTHINVPYVFTEQIVKIQGIKL